TIWGVEEYEVERPARGAQERERVAALNVGLRDADLVDVAPDRGDRALVVVDERRGGGAARERLDPERAAARVEVEHARAPDLAEHREERLTHLVRGRPRRPPLGGVQGPALEAPGDDAHRASVLAGRRTLRRRRARRAGSAARPPGPRTAR